jgi:hypothetical protein
MPPLKREGTPPSVPVPKELLTEPQSKSLDTHTQHGCAHRSTVTQRLPDAHKHYSKEICISCGAFLRWLPRPENVERQNLNAFKLARLAMCARLSPWECAFVREVSQRRKVSPKQQEIIDRLCATYLQGGAK